jgi:hypothetical protein
MPDTQQQGKDRKLLGGSGQRRDQAGVPVGATWQTDVIRNRDPDFVYEFPHESKVRDLLHSTRVALTDFVDAEGNAGTRKTRVYDIPGWEIVHRETGPEEAAGWRPDEGKPLDTVLRHGPHVCMRIRREHWEILQRAQEQRSDAYEGRLQAGHREDYDMDGRQTRLGRGQRAAVSLNEHPLQRI